MINRTQQPPVIIPEHIAIQEANISEISGGIPVYVIEAGTQSVVKIELVFAAGKITSSHPLLAAAANDLLDEGTAKYNSAELAEALDFYGAYLQTENGADWSSVSLFSLNKFVDDTLPFLIELINAPVYPEKEIQTYRKQGKQRLAVNLNKVDFIARRSFIHELYGDQHPYGILSNADHYDSINSEVLKAFHEQHYKNGLKAIIISGLPGKSTIQSILTSIEAAGFNKGNLPSINAELPGTSKKIIPKADALQSSIRIGRRLFNRKHKDYFTFSVLNAVLGGYFGSRLMSNIREDKGFTYGIGSGLISQDTDGYFFISTEVGADVREAAVKEIYHEITRLREEEIPTEELKLVKNYLIGSFQRSIDSPFSLADRHKMLCLNNLNSNHLSDYLKRINTVQPADLLKCANQYLQAADLTEIIVGR